MTLARLLAEVNAAKVKHDKEWLSDTLLGLLAAARGAPDHDALEIVHRQCMAAAGQYAAYRVEQDARPDYRWSSGMTALRIGPHDDPEQATRALAASMAAAAANHDPDPDGLRHNVESWRDPAARRLAPALAAAKRGHVVEWDPPAALTSVERWTCIHCGDAVLYRAEFGRTYGGAIEGDCTRPALGNPR